MQWRKSRIPARRPRRAHPAARGGEGRDPGCSPRHPVLSDSPTSPFLRFCPVRGALCWSLRGVLFRDRLCLGLPRSRRPQPGAPPAAAGAEAGPGEGGGGGAGGRGGRGGRTRLELEPRPWPGRRLSGARERGGADRAPWRQRRQSEQRGQRLATTGSGRGSSSPWGTCCPRTWTTPGASTLQVRKAQRARGVPPGAPGPRPHRAPQSWPGRVLRESGLRPGGSWCGPCPSSCSLRDWAPLLVPF